MIGKYLKPGAVFPEKGLGAGNTPGDLVINAIKLCVIYHIHLTVIDEAAAADGTCPLELLADCSGTAWGGAAYQMTKDLTTLCTAYSRQRAHARTAGVESVDLGVLCPARYEESPGGHAGPDALHLMHGSCERQKAPDC